MIKRYTTLSLICLLLTGSCSVSEGQTSKTYGIPYIQNYSPEDYDGGGQNWDLLSGDDGLMYFANRDGVLIYDGTNWTKIKLSNGRTARSLSQDDNGRIYVGGINDLGYLAQDTLGSLSFVSLKPLIPEEFQDFADVWTIISIGDGTFFHTGNYIFRYQNDSIQVMKNGTEGKRPTFHLAWEINNQFYVRDTGFGLLRYEEGALKMIKGGEKFANEYLRYFLPYDSGRFFSVSDRGIPFLFDDKGLLDKYAEKFYLLEKHLRNQFTIRAIQLPDGNYCFSFVNRGVLIITPEGSPVYQLNKDKGLISNTINQFTRDQFGNIWLATQDGISQILYNSPLTSASKTLGIDVPVNDAVIKDDKLYLATRAGILIEEGDRFNRPQKRNVLEAWDLQLVEEDLYAVFTSSVAQIFEDQPAKAFVQSVPGWVLTPLKKRPNHYLIGIYNRGFWIYQHEATGWKGVGSSTGYRGNARNVIEDEEEQFWISDGRAKITRVQLDDILDSAISIVRYDSVNGLFEDNTNHVLDYFPNDSKYPLIASGPNYYQYDAAKDTFLLYEPLSGLVGGQKAGQFDIDEQGTIYTFSDQSPVRFFKEGSKYLVDSVSLKKMNGLQTNRIIVLPDQSVLYCTRDGLIQVHPDKIGQAKNDYEVKIRQVASDQYPLFGGANTSKRFAEAGDALDFDNNNVTFNYSAIFYEESEKTQYQYKLIGFDEEWSEWTTETYKEYTNLNEGDYNFKVRAKNLYDQISSEDSFQFKVSPPWYRTSASYVGYTGVLVLLIWGILKIYTRKLENDKRKLEGIIEERTQEISKQKDEIAHQAQELRQSNQKLLELDQFKQDMTSMIVHDLKNPLGVIIHKGEKQTVGLAKKMLNLVLNILDVQKFEDTEVKLNLESKHFSALVNDALYEVRDESLEKNLSIQTHIEESLEVPLDPELITRTIVNLLTNAIKYSPVNGSINISVKRSEKGEVLFQMQDQGPGIPEDKLEVVFDRFIQVDKSVVTRVKSTGLGLAFCKLAVEAHGGKIGVNSTENQGAAFWFTLPDAQASNQEVKLDTPDETSQLSADDIKKLRVIVPQLRATKIYKATEIEKLVNSVERTSGSALDQYCQQLIDAAYHANSEVYDRLLDQVSANTN